MAELNHTIVWCSDKQRSAEFLTGILGLAPARTFFHFLVVDLANGVSLDFYQKRARSRRSTTPSLSATKSSTRRSVASRQAVSISGPIPRAVSGGRSTRISAAAASTSPTRTTTCWN